MKPKKIARYAAKLAGLVLMFWLIPVVASIWLVCGLIDFSRNRNWSGFAINRYFFGNGFLTWLISPFNLAIDLLCNRNPGVVRWDDLPEVCRAELDQTFAALRAKQADIRSAFENRGTAARRGMIFYRWYDHDREDLAGTLGIPPRFKYVKTVGVSCFTGNEATSWHFGPLRLTYRVLLNLDPVASPDAFIDVGRHHHEWCKDPLFIFDDTLLHRSVNATGSDRFCAFIDIIRPSPFVGVLQALISVMQVVFLGVNRLFYRNWAVLQPPTNAGTQV